MPAYPLDTRRALVHSLVSQPRFLRAIPSLMVLTTAIVWGVASHAGVLEPDAGARSHAGAKAKAGASSHGLVGRLGAGVATGTGLVMGAGRASMGLHVSERTGASDTAVSADRTAAEIKADAGAGGPPILR